MNHISAMIDSSTDVSDFETLSDSCAFSADLHDEAQKFPAFQITYTLTVYFNSDKLNQEYRQSCAAVLGEAAGLLPPLSLPRLATTMQDVVVESYDESTVMLSSEDREAILFFEHGGIIADSTGTPIWRVGSDILYNKNEHTMVATLVSIFPCFIVH